MTEFCSNQSSGSLKLSASEVSELFSVPDQYGAGFGPIDLCADSDPSIDLCADSDSPIDLFADSYPSIDLFADSDPSTSVRTADSDPSIDLCADPDPDGQINETSDP